ncbi:MAG: hypothetical protein C5B52_09700 [Bacteroidetes bacterium]|nr:MAG: hypothetical protein C5B52_09700 [Bacteroidota bacterium]
MLRPKVSELVIQIIVGLIFISLPLVFQAGQLDWNTFISIFKSVYTWLFIFLYVFLYYFHSYVLIPYLYFKKRFALYILSLFILLIAVYYARPIENFFRHSSMARQNFQPPPGMQGKFPGAPAPLRMPRPPRVDFASIFLFVMVIALSGAVQINRRWRKSEQRIAEAEAEKTQAELSFLKVQLNPHFLFNTLNNLYSLAISKHEHTAEGIMKLSSIMRYFTDEVTENFVPLSSEINCIRNYIDLQRLRLGNKAIVGFSVHGEPDDLTIAPLVLMVFVENAFKYGISNHESSSIDIRINIEKESIDFLCRNKILKKSTQSERSGIGITNTQKRLEHLYADRHFFNISNENNFFTVRLKIRI